jgi:hypothetical protein
MHKCIITRIEGYIIHTLRERRIYPYPKRPKNISLYWDIILILKGPKYMKIEIVERKACIVNYLFNVYSFLYALSIWVTYLRQLSGHVVYCLNWYLGFCYDALALCDVWRC